jgi:hypothetical protein
MLPCAMKKSKKHLLLKGAFCFPEPFNYRRFPKGEPKGIPNGFPNGAFIINILLCFLRLTNVINILDFTKFYLLIFNYFFYCQW